MRIVLFNREWLFLRQFLVPRVRMNVKIARYMINDMILIADIENRWEN